MIAAASMHLQALRKSGMLTESYRRMYRPDAAMVKPEKVIRLLRDAGIRFVVMGTHGIGGYRDEPRATQDIDVLVGKRGHRKAVSVLEAAYPRLKVQDTPVLTRFVDPATGKGVIDLMKPYMRLYQLVFKNAVKVAKAYLIPSLEVALVCKYAAMTSPNRSEDRKFLDAGDFINIVRHNFEKIDLKKLRELGDTVYPVAGAEIARYVDDAQAGRKLRI